MEDDIEELRFEEIDDNDFTTSEHIEEVETLKDETFMNFYNPIRNIFANDNSLLDKFSLCKSHIQRLELLLNQEVVKTSLSELSVQREAVTEDVLLDLPENDTNQKPWKPPPKLSYGVHKKYPHLSKALDVRLKTFPYKSFNIKLQMFLGEILKNRRSSFSCKAENSSWRCSDS